MTARERVLASRLIQKIDNNNSYAREIGLSYMVSTVGDKEQNSKPVKNKEKNN